MIKRLLRKSNMKIETFLLGSFLAYMNITMGVDVLMAFNPSIELHGASFIVPRWTGWPIMFCGELILAIIVWAFFKKHLQSGKHSRTVSHVSTIDSSEKTCTSISGWEACCALGGGLAFVFRGFSLAFKDFSENGLGPQHFPAPQSIGWPTALLGACLFIGGLCFYIRDNNQ